MKGLVPKISRGGANKSKVNLGAPIIVKSFLQNIAGGSSWQEKFVNCASADEQLDLLKNIINELKVSNDSKVIEFLVIVFYEAPAKHPVKFFLARHVTKCSSMEKPFTEFLLAHILSQLENNVDMYDYNFYAEMVPRVLLCIENFPAGAAAVESVDATLLIKRLIHCYVGYCRRQIRYPPLPVTKMNEIFSLEHLMLRLLVHVIQKLNKEQDYGLHPWGNIFVDILYFVNELFIDEDVPIDTKSLGGILFLLVETLSFGEDVYQRLLENTEIFSIIGILRHKAGQLAVYSAIATTVPMEKLKEQTYDRTPAILILLDKLLSFADGSTVEPAQTLCVSRSLVHLSKSLVHLNESPEHLIKSPEHLSKAPEHLSKAPEHLIKSPEHLSKAPEHLSKAPVHLIKSPEHLSESLGVRAAAKLLAFVWPHLDYHLDSVRHLTQQILDNVLAFCADLEKAIGGERESVGPLAPVLRSVRSLGPRCALRSAARAVPVLGAGRVLRDLCPATQLLDAAEDPHLHAAACSAIAAVVAGTTASSAGLFRCWVEPALGRPAARDAVLEAVIRKDEGVLKLIAERALLACCRFAPQCRALLPRDTLRHAAVHTDKETRLLSLHLSCVSRRATEPAAAAELAAALTFTRYNLREQDAAVRHAMIDNIVKLLKRIEDSYRVMRRQQSPCQHYVTFVQRLRALCFSAARREASDSRRAAALQLLAAVSSLQLPPHIWEWKKENVESVLQLLDDSYDSNKELALQVLRHCPRQLLVEEKYSTSLQPSELVAEASDWCAAAGAGAACKLRLVLELELVPRGAGTCYGYTGDPQWKAHYVVLFELLTQLHRELARRCGVHGAHGVLRCAGAVLRHVPASQWESQQWVALAEMWNNSSLNALADALPAVSTAAPEGYLPNFDCEILEDGRAITSQMVLVCAWRTIKEASAVLSIVAPLCWKPAAARAGRALAGVAAHAQHRGAADQAAASLHHLTKRCSTDLRSELVTSLLGEAALAERATRRGAGLPAAIQAVVAAELVTTGSAECFNKCMDVLLRQASGAPSDCSDNAPSTSVPKNAALTDAAPGDDVTRRTLAANILRALFRHSALEAVAQEHVAAGLRLAVCGFTAPAWMERSSMSLLLAALAVRVFGVSRARGAVHVRNTMSGRTFFARYPDLYQLMMSKLEEGSKPERVDGSAFPALLLLARLYPSALDGATSAVKVSSFVPLVERCSHSPVYKTRQLAAAALRALLPPAQFFPHMERMFGVLSDRRIARNYCHGVLLQLRCMLETPPDAPRVSDAPGAPDAPGPFDILGLFGAPVTPDGPRVSDAPRELSAGGSVWLLAQAVGSLPCFVIAREYAHVINLLVWRFPEVLQNCTLSAITTVLGNLLFADRVPIITAGRELCLADCLYLYLILLHRKKNLLKIAQVVLKTLQHKSYEVVLASLNYLLILHRETEIDDCNLQQHLSSVCDKKILELLRGSPQYIAILSDVYKAGYMECRLKSLKVLSLENDTQTVIINDTLPSYCTRNLWIATKLLKYTEIEDKLTPMYLDSLLKFTSERVRDSSFDYFDIRRVLDVMTMVYLRSSGGNSICSRSVVVSYLESDLGTMMKLDLSKLYDSEKFTYRAAILATLVTLLEDDDETIRRRAAGVVTELALPRILGAGAAGDDTPGDKTLGDVTPREKRLGDATPEDGIEDVTSGDLTGDVTPGDKTLGDVTPSDGTEHVTSEDDTLGDGSLDAASLARASADSRGGVVAGACGQLLRDHIRGEDSAAMFALLALMDFRAGVCAKDELNDECRVFDQSERYNIFLDEAEWTEACAEKIIKFNKQNNENLVDYVLAITKDKKYRNSFDFFCKDNLIVYEKMAKYVFVKDETVNPKIELFIRKLRGQY